MAYRNRISLLIGLALLFLGSSVLRADPNLIVDIDQAIAPPAIDGDVGDWGEVRWIRFAPGAPQMSGINVLADDGAAEPWGTAGTAADLSGSFAFQWDEDWIYLAAQVTDNVHDVSEGAGGLWFQKDSVSLFLDIPLDGDGEAWIAGDHSFSLVADPSYPESGRWWRHGEETGQKEVPAPPQTRLALRLGERGNYTLEAAIPMAALTQITPDFCPPFENRMVGFLLLVTDPDQGPSPWGGQLSYGGGNDNDSDWSRLRFVPARRAPAATGTLSGKVPYEHDGAPWAGGRVQVKDQEGKVEAEARTSEDGQYQIQVGPGDYQLSAGSRATAIKVEQGEYLKVDLVVPPTLARLSFWVPPQRMAEFSTVYEAKVAPILKKHGLIATSARSRATVDSVFSRLFAFKTPSALVAKQQELQGDSTWGAVLRGLGASFGTSGPDSLIQSGLVIYAAPAGPGKTVPAGPGTGTWRTYDVTDGLGSASARAIFQDREGYLWLGSNGGVSRYDGHNFTTFTTQDGLASNTVGSIAQDREGHLWFGTDGGVSRYDGKIFTTFTVKDGLVDKRVNSIIQDQEGYLWFGTPSGASRYDGSSFTTFTVKDGLASNWVQSIIQDRGGHLWFGTPSGASRYDGSSFTTFSVKDGLVDNLVASIIQDREGNLWFGTSGGVSRYNSKAGDRKAWTTFTTKDGLADNSVLSMLQDREGHLWFGTRGSGASQYDGKSFITVTAEDGLASNWVTVVLQDREGSLWFGTASGVSQYDGKTFTVLTTKDGLAGTTLWSILQDREGYLWFGTLGNGVSRYDGKSFTTFTAEDGLASDRVRTVFQDQEGNLWFGTNGGVTRYDGKAMTTFTTEDGLAGNRVVSIFQDREGYLWFGTYEGGVSRFDGRIYSAGSGLAFTTFRKKLVFSGMEANGVEAIYQDREGYLWFGTHEDGASRFDGKVFTTFTTKDGLASNWVRSIIQDRDGDLWFATFGGGATRYDGKTFRTFSAQDGLAGNGVNVISEDREGHLWFGTSGGVSQYDGQTFQTLTRQDGLASSGTTEIFQDSAGDLWFGTLGAGVTRYHPPPPSPPLAFVDAVVADRRYEGVAELSVPSSVKLTAFEFHGASFKTRPEQMVYRYRLTGYDQDWKNTRDRRVEYQDLPRGSYTFEVQAVDRDLVYSEKPATVALRVHLPYDRVALLSALGLALALVGWQTVRVVRRGRRLREANAAMSEANRELFSVNRQLEQTLEEKEKAQELLVRSESMAAIGTLVAGVAHELNNPLGAAYSLTQTVQEMIQEDSLEQLDQERAEIVDHLAFSRKELNRAKEIVASLLGLSRQNQDYTEAVELNTVVQDALLVLHNQYKKYEVNITEQYEEGLPSVQGNFAQLGQVCMNLIKNAIEALKGGEGQILLKTYREREQVVFECADTGPGIPDEVMQNIFKPFFTTKGVGEGTGLGLYICHQTVEKHHGTIEVVSEVGKGTRFRVRLPHGKR